MTLADLAWAIEDLRARLEPYRLAVDYDEGRHRLTFATDKYRNAFGDLFREFADNMCDDVVDGITDRLQINGWSTGDDDQVGQLADEVWSRSRGAARAGGVHRNGFREGDGFVIVQEDSRGVAQFWRQSPSQMAVRYSQDNPDQVELAAKVWKEGARYRATLFYPDGLRERYATRGLGIGGGMPQARAFQLLAAGDPALRAMGLESAVDDEAEGMPVFHYPNGEVSGYGRSLIEKVIPLQDALNKAVTDMLVAMEFHAYPQRWATGVEVQRDPVTQQEVSPFKAGEGRVWRVGKSEARMGQFDPAQMDGFLDVQDSFRLEIARKGYLPPHAVNLRSGGTPPTGISMLVSEGKAVKTARDRQRDWGYQHCEAMAYGLRLMGAGGVLASDLHLEWAPPETRDEAAFWEMAAAKKAVGVPLKQILLEANYTAKQVQEFLEDQEAVSEAEELTRAAMSGGRRGLTQGQALALPAAPASPAGAPNPALAS